MSGLILLMLADAFSDPNDVSNFLLFQLDERVEDAKSHLTEAFCEL